MPVVSCPKCPTKLRVADGATGKVKCPKCQTIFSAAPVAAPAPAFEVVDEPPAKPVAPPPVPAAKAAKPESDFDFDTSSKKKRRDDDDDDDDDRPRKKRRRDDDDDDDRPRSKRRRDDDDDDYDDRPRKKRRRDDDYDDDYDDRPSKKKGSGFGPAKTGALLMGIGLWFYVAMFGILALFSLVGMATNLPAGLFGVAGLCGVTNTVLTLIGLSFCIAGPAKSKGIAIATVSVAGVHLVLVAISYNNITGGMGGRGMGGGMGFMGGIDWLLLGTVIWVVDVVLPVLIYGGGGVGGASGEAILLIAASACEIARMIMVCITLKSLATAAKDYDAAEKAGSGVMMTCIVCGAAAGVTLLLVVIIEAAKSINLLRYGGALGATAILVGYALMAMTAAFAAMQTKDALARRARRG